MDILHFLQKYFNNYIVFNNSRPQFLTTPASFEVLALFFAILNKLWLKSLGIVQLGFLIKQPRRKSGCSLLFMGGEVREQEIGNQGIEKQAQWEPYPYSWAWFSVLEDREGTV